jgi:hypothetical protein
MQRFSFQRSTVRRYSFAVLLVFLLLGCGSRNNPPPGTESTNLPAKVPAKVPAKAASDEPAVSKDGRWILSLSDSGFVIKGSPVQIGRTTKGEFEKLLGASDRVVDLEKFNPFSVDELVFWDKKGISVHCSKKTGRAAYFNCDFLGDENQELSPRNSFDGVLKVDGVEISKATTKKMLQERTGKQIQDHSNNLPGFSIKFQNHWIAFEQTKDRQILQSIRISPPIGFRP